MIRSSGYCLVSKHHRHTPGYNKTNTTTVRNIRQWFSTVKNRPSPSPSRVARASRSSRPPVPHTPFEPEGGEGRPSHPGYLTEYFCAFLPSPPSRVGLGGGVARCFSAPFATNFGSGPETVVEGRAAGQRLLCTFRRRLQVRAWPGGGGGGARCWTGASLRLLPPTSGDCGRGGR